SPPVAFDKWIFDKLAQDDDGHIATNLGVEPTEVYSPAQRKVMIEAISEARRICTNAALKVESPDDAAKALLRQYFTDATNTDLTDICVTLAKGYKKIAAGLGSSSLIISDEPGDRLGGGWNDWAFIYPSEDMKVIYLQNAWLKKADEATPDNSSPLHRCARTIIHEMSHKECRTEDICYGPKGLKPNGALTGAHALHNADSWAYFAVAVNGLLTGPDAANATKKNVAIRNTPSRQLTL
ncbi:M35 family metallo-endopeptidase, partial [Pararhodobacter sp. SW119]|uniref:M35 family metallo-endopeptidase n=1 Tax=Pararhodobacter sp. SW119 TaxID=2780075 RepID=UPI001ADF433C